MPQTARLMAQAVANQRRGRLEQAMAGYNRVLSSEPEHDGALNNLGVALRVTGRWAAAVACYRRALAVRPERADIYSNLGNVLRDLGRLDEAAEALQKAIDLAPEEVGAYYNLGLTMKDLGHPGAAMHCFEKTLKAKPDHTDCQWDRALLLLEQGDYEQGFAAYESRWLRPDSPPREFDQPRWDGGPLDGKTIFLHQEQGFGDIIQFVRFAPQIAALGGRVIIECSAPLTRLLATAPGVAAVVERGEEAEFDVFAPLLSVANLLGTTLATLPVEIPYLEASAASAPPAKPGHQRIGITWAGKPSHKNDHNRSCPLVHFVELSGRPKIQLFSLQKGPRSVDLKEFATPTLVADLGSGLGDFADTAAVMANLDLIITVDTAVAHLAGALGKPVWVLLPFAPDWRWMRDRDDNPWYPSIRLFRQHRPGDWDGVFQRVNDALEDY